MILLNPNQEDFNHLDEKSKEIMKQTIEHFESRGKNRLKEDRRNRKWYKDFLNFLKDNKIFSKLLTPSKYSKSDPDTRWDTFRNCDFNEILGFYNLSHWYTWQVTILGLGPIWMSKNESIKKKTADFLEKGNIFAFGLSEKTHGADLYSSDMSITPLGDGKYIADGGKYYIGNANEAAFVSTFAKNSETDEYTFFVAEPENENYDLIQNVVDWESYVAEYALNGYPLTDAEILSSGREAWDSALNTINVGKFNLGWAAIGICTHAFYEGLNHASNRNLYGKYVTEFPHIRQMFVEAYSRLVAMKLFSKRATDYMRAASENDRRYLLFNPMVKMKVPTQGEIVINLIWDVIAAKGFEKDTYFEMAAVDIRALPKLEGTVHVNMALIIKFMSNYFFNPGEFDSISKQDNPICDEFLFNQGATRGLGKIQFHDYKLAYDSIDTPNVNIFKEQIKILKEMLINATPDKAQSKNMDFLLYLGEMFTLVAYGQLIIEKQNMEDFGIDLLEQIFDFMIRDFSEYALKLYSKADTTTKQMEYCLKIVKKPVTDFDRFDKFWADYISKIKNLYVMNP
jgi:acyl-CoA dehydrogenase